MKGTVAPKCTYKRIESEGKLQLPAFWHGQAGYLYVESEVNRYNMRYAGGDWNEGIMK